MSYFICPYCDKENEDPYLEQPRVDEVFEHECEHCEKNFVFTIDWNISYSEEKADCLNGGEHNWEKICGYPEEVYRNKRRCSMCDAEKKFTDEELKKFALDKDEVKE